jgi:putative acetyltransferase
MNDMSIIPYSATYQSDFKRLNIEWISRFFVVEPHDLEQLDHPEMHILTNNGQIFLARLGDAIVGCVAMVNMSDPIQENTEFELAKMAVSPFKAKELVKSCV